MSPCTTFVTRRLLGSTEVSSAAPVTNFIVDAGTCGAPASLFHRVWPVTGSITIPVNCASFGFFSGAANAAETPAAVGAFFDAASGTILALGTVTPGSGRAGPLGWEDPAEDAWVVVVPCPASASLPVSFGHAMTPATATAATSSRMPDTIHTRWVDRRYLATNGSPARVPARTLPREWFPDRAARCRGGMGSRPAAGAGAIRFPSRLESVRAIAAWTGPAGGRG